MQAKVLRLHTDLTVCELCTGVQDLSAEKETVLQQTICANHVFVMTPENLLHLMKTSVFPINQVRTTRNKSSTLLPGIIILHSALYFII